MTSDRICPTCRKNFQCNKHCGHNENGPIDDCLCGDCFFEHNDRSPSSKPCEIGWQSPLIRNRKPRIGRLIGGVPIQ